MGSMAEGDPTCVCGIEGEVETWTCCPEMDSTTVVDNTMDNSNDTCACGTDPEEYTCPCPANNCACTDGGENDPHDCACTDTAMPTMMIQEP
jgi:hypothetical protein